jgi:hypothetical protein
LPLGALAGFGGALRVARDGSEEWTPAVWFGVALGVALGPVIYVSGVGRPRFDLINALIVAIVTAMSGTVVGMLAATGEGLWVRARKGKSRFATTVLGFIFAFVPAALLFVLLSMLFGRQFTGFQVASSILIGVPILCGSVTWAKGEGRRKVR